MKFYGQWDPPIDKVLYQGYFKKLKNGFFIEAGAFDGINYSSCKFFEESMGWKGINVEPVPFLFNLLKKNRPHSINIGKALSDTSTTKSFTHAIHPRHRKLFGNGSLDHNKNHLEDLKKAKCTFETFDVQTITYAELLRQHDVEHIDLFILDVEGHESQVIKTMVGHPILPSVFCVEHGRYIDKKALQRLIERLGYKLDQKSFNNFIYIKHLT